jgi:hypothetical protein
MTTPDFSEPSGGPVPSAPSPVAPSPVAPLPVALVPPRRRSGPMVAVIAGAVVLLVLVLVGAGITVGLTLSRSSGPASSAPTTAPATAATQIPAETEPPAFSGPLQSLVIPKPYGAVYAPEKRMGDKDGVVTKQDVASEFTTTEVAAVVALLTDDEFQRGVFLAWTDKGTLVFVQIFQFRYDREAVSWITDVERVAENFAAATAVFDEIPYGRWFVTKTSDGLGGVHALFDKGPFAVQIDTFKTGEPDVDGTKQMAIDQYQLLP